MRTDKRWIRAAAAGLLSAALAAPALAADHAAAKPADGASKQGVRVTPEEAEAMVKKGVAYLKANGRAKAMADFSDPHGQFVDRELYLTVYNFEGVSQAHGANAKMIGKNLIDLRDSNGKELIRERLELAKTKTTFWQDYTFVNPLNKKIEPKRVFCEVAADVVICGGIYKPGT